MSRNTHKWVTAPKHHQHQGQGKTADNRVADQNTQREQQQLLHLISPFACGAAWAC